VSTFEQTYRIAIPTDHPDPLARVEEFLLLNGYESSEGMSAFCFERGKPGAGWWANNMYELHTQLRCDPMNDVLLLHYRVDTKGQHLSEMERNYWVRESQRIEKILAGTADCIDLRPIEKQRADATVRRLRSTGVMLAIVVFLILCVVLLLRELY
jgi:hypothetical protein